ncbi:sulfite exporter TauE/SafE family protein [Variovorax saccharolyticus]|uniref:sulfite exporter TauE/SafE family protein n=1 Tax=Variovorax saccharolyticus TaxID=3053516 RepID=UPI002576ACE4|nr:sulfite exporter TauE/SafE family protein [Variovorax sp. J31P216]MDM0023148.1 sulfite exporter TauE/SafE family protein [Variovorax sp. J31P216]
MSSSIYLIVALGALVAGFVQGLSGFAFGLVAMSFWAWAVDPLVAAMLAVFGALVGQLIAAVTVRRGFDWPTLWPFLVGGLAGVPLGVWLLPRLDVPLFKACVGGLLVIWCPAMLMARSLPKIQAGGRTADGVSGLLGGVCSGVAGFSGAIPTLWCTVRGMPKDASRAVVQNFNLAMLAVSFAIHLAAGNVRLSMLPLFGIVAGAVLLPVLLGARLYAGISEAAFRNLVLGLLTASGVALLASSLPALAVRAG